MNGPGNPNSDESELDAPDGLASHGFPQDVLDALGQGRFSNIEYISSGATSSVYSAHDKNLDKVVAIKLLSHADAAKLIKFQTEAKTACKLDHKNLVKTLNFGVTKKNHAYLIMNYVEGPSLESLIEQQGPISIDIAIRLFIQICDGMIHSHGKKITHRDLKTSNIIVQSFGSDAVNVIVVDFGLAKERQSQEKTQQGTSSGKVRGSPMFISPEQAQGKVGDERSDIYSFGCIMFRTLTAGWVFEADDMFELLRKHIEEPAPELSSAAPGLRFDQALEQLVQRMLEKEPQKRYQSMREVKDALLEIQKERAGVDEGPQKAAVRKAPVEERKGLGSRLAVPLILLALLVVSALSLRFFNTPESQLSQEEKLRLEKLEQPRKKLERLFRIDTSMFMSHIETEQLIVKEAYLLRDWELSCFDDAHAPVPNINLSYASKLTGEGFKHFANIPGLALELNYTNLTPAAYIELGKLKNLEGLSLSSTSVTNEDLKCLVGLPQLKELCLDTCKNLDDECLDTISKFSALEVFVARDQKSRLTDRGISKLAKCRRLSFIQIDGADITDDGVRNLLSLQNMLDIRLNRCRRVTGESLKAITRSFPQLHLIGFGFTRTKSEDLACLANCKNLEYIEIPGVPITDEQMKMFGQLKDLKWLYLSDVNCTEKGLTYLYPLKNMRKIVWMRIDVPKDAIVELQKQLPNTIFVTPGRPQEVDETMSSMLDMMKN
jgi:serine/threonine protein kinase